MQNFGKLVKFFLFCCELNEQSSLCTCEFKQIRTMQFRSYLAREISLLFKRQKDERTDMILGSNWIETDTGNWVERSNIGKIENAWKNTKLNVLSNLLQKLQWYGSYQKEMRKRELKWIYVRKLCVTAICSWFDLWKRRRLCLLYTIKTEMFVVFYDRNLHMNVICSKLLSQRTAINCMPNLK